VQGLLRGGAAELRGIRVMSSGLPQPQWNGGDVDDSEPDLAGAAAFFAARGVPWGVRVPAGMPWPHGRHVRRLDLMGVEPARFGPVPPPPGLELRAAGPADLDGAAAVDAAAFGADARAWLAPQLDAEPVDVALAALGGEPVATGYAVRSDGRAGPAVLLAGVAVVPAARRRGIGAALSSWLLTRAFAGGAALAHLQADTPEAARVYARLGFAPAGALEVYEAPARLP